MATIGYGMQERRARRRLEEFTLAVRSAWDMVTRSMVAFVIGILGAVLLLSLHYAYQFTMADKAIPDPIVGLIGSIPGYFAGLLTPRPGDSRPDTRHEEREQDDRVRSGNREGR